MWQPNHLMPPIFLACSFICSFTWNELEYCDSVPQYAFVLKSLWCDYRKASWILQIIVSHITPPLHCIHILNGARPKSNAFCNTELQKWIYSLGEQCINLFVATCCRLHSCDLHLLAANSPVYDVKSVTASHGMHFSRDRQFVCVLFRWFSTVMP